MTQRSDILIDLLKQIDIAGKALQMYPEEHPRVTQSMQHLMALVSRNMENRENITFSISDGNLFVEGQMVEKGNPVLDRLTRDLAVRNIYHVTLQKGVREEEFVSVLQDLQLKPQRLLQRGGMEKLLEEQKVENILVNKLKFGIIDADEEGKVGSLDQEILPELLMAIQGALTGNSDFAATAKSVEASLDDVNVPDSGDILLRIFHIISQNAPAIPEDSPDHSIKDRLVDLYRSFTPPLRRRLLRTAALRISRGESQESDRFYRSLSQEELDEAVLSLLDESVAQEELRPFLENLIADSEAHLSEELLKRLKEKGLLLDESRSWEHLLAKGNLEPKEIENVPEILGKLIAEGNIEAADRLTRLVFLALTGGHPDQKIASIRMLPSILLILSEEEKWKNIQTSTSFLVGNCFRKERDAEVSEALLHYLFVSFRKNIATGEFQKAREVLTVLHSRVDREEILRNQLSDRVMEVRDSFSEILRDGSEDVDVVLECLKICGASGAEFLLDSLADEDDQKARSNLIREIALLRNEDTLPLIQRSLSDSRWYIVRNMVTILNRIPGEESRKLLSEVAANPDPKVGMEVVKGIYRSSSSEDAPVVMQLLKHPDKSIRIQAAHLSSVIDLKESIPFLQEFANSRSAEDTDLRTAGLQAMLRMKAPEAVQPAILTLERKPTRQEVSERNVAVRILGEMKGGDYRTLLERITQTDINPETRALAAQYLERPS